MSDDLPVVAAMYVVEQVWTYILYEDGTYVVRSERDNNTNHCHRDAKWKIVDDALYYYNPPSDWMNWSNHSSTYEKKIAARLLLLIAGYYAEKELLKD